MAADSGLNISLTKASSVQKKAHYLVSRQESEQTTIKVVWALEERKALPPSATAAVIEAYIV